MSHELLLAKLEAALDAAVNELRMHDFTFDETAQFIVDALNVEVQRHNQQIQSGRWRRP